jgi:hypothetical protein
MDNFKVIKLVTLHAGIVRLSDAQASSRAHKLEPVKGRKGCYLITAPNQFKAGEEFGYEGEIPKALADNLTGAAEAEKAAKKAEAEAEKARKKAEAEAQKAAEKQAEEDAKAQAKIEADAKAEWDKNEALRAEFGGNFQAYLDSLKAE